MIRLGLRDSSVQWLCGFALALFLSCAMQTGCSAKQGCFALRLDSRTRYQRSGVPAPAGALVTSIDPTTAAELLATRAAFEAWIRPLLRACNIAMTHREFLGNVRIEPNARGHSLTLCVSAKTEPELVAAILAEALNQIDSADSVTKAPIRGAGSNTAKGSPWVTSVTNARTGRAVPFVGILLDRRRANKQGPLLELGVDAKPTASPKGKANDDQIEKK